MSSIDSIIDFDVNDKRLVFQRARHGVDADIFIKFSELTGISKSQLGQALHINAKTINTYVSSNKTLAPVEGEHLLKLISLFKHGETILGSIDEFISWIKTASGKEGSTYLDLLETPGGIDIVVEELNRIAEGYPV